MSRVKRFDCLFRGTEGLMAVVAGLLLVSLSLWAYGTQIQAPADLPAALLALFLASWIGVVGLAGSALIPLWLLVRATTSCR